MNYFLNLESGRVSINTFRKPAAMSTDVDDLVDGLHLYDYPELRDIQRDAND